MAEEHREPETTQQANMAGEINSTLNISRLLALLRTAGLDASLRESSHYNEGHYIRIDSETDAQIDFTLERYSPDEYLARAFASSVRELYEASLQVSVCLNENGLQHRFEVYDEQGHLIHYLPFSVSK